MSVSLGVKVLLVLTYYLPLISSATHKLKFPLMLQVGEIVGS